MENEREGGYRCREVTFDLPDRCSKRGEGLIRALQSAVFVTTHKCINNHHLYR
ncbi:hypothetical protein HOLleu_30991 [Holothuria leucospilota]|uniref:Uncharacterized protein n=1 Tax=Holothuria leucospilota TaxID=206669 RepID=A0A9Q1BL68_HOLLE|nr:hypothetical protein HOLleu_30991 [Holothuria leucospilota]